MNKYKRISKQEFEHFLEKYYYQEFSSLDYRFDWENKPGNGWIRIALAHAIQEYCYKIKLDNNYCLKVYSSVDKKTNWTRNVKEDAIRIVPAESLSLEPIRASFPHIKRMDHWTINFQERINQILKSLRKEHKCIECGNSLYLRNNRNSKENFLGCSQFPACKAKGISLGEISP